MNKWLKKLNKWTTSKKIVVWALFMMIMYTIVGTLFTVFTDNYLDSTITTCFFDAMKWSCGTSGLLGVADKGIRVAQIIKGSNDEGSLG